MTLPEQELREIADEAVEWHRNDEAPSVRLPVAVTPEMAYGYAQGVIAERLRSRDLARRLARALRPFARFGEQWRRMPLRGIGNDFYTIHGGTEFEATLRLSDMQAALDALNTAAARGLLDEPASADAAEGG